MGLFRMNKKLTAYGEAIREGFQYILNNNEKSFVIGQGLWSPWYVGNSMRDLDKEFGKKRILDTPVSELATTGAAIGAGLNGYSVIVVHPRMDFMLLAADQIVNQAAKWRHMLGGQSSPNVTFRSIINRGGEQGAQHSQALHSWYSHIPGLRVVMPAFALDARDMLIAAAQSPDPVMYIDDRWCYEYEQEITPPKDVDIKSIKPKIVRPGRDLTIAACGYSVQLAVESANLLSKENGFNCEVIDVRQLNPLDSSEIINSAKKTGRFLALDGGWSNSGFAAELLAQVSENLSPSYLKVSPKRITLAEAPAPTSAKLEDIYYLTPVKLKEQIKNIFTGND